MSGALDFQRKSFDPNNFVPQVHVGFLLWHVKSKLAPGVGTVSVDQGGWVGPSLIEPSCGAFDF